MVKLQEKVQAMLDGETKRRNIAIKFLEEVKEILIPVGESLWGSGDDAITLSSIWIRKREKDKIFTTNYYFRYGSYIAENRDEYEGFYLSDLSYPLWGDSIIDLKGSDFWAAIGCIIEWVSYVTELMDTRSESRNKLLDKIK